MAAPRLILTLAGLLLLPSSAMAQMMRLPRSVDDAFAAGRHGEAFEATRVLLEQCRRDRAATPRDCIDLQLALSEFAPKAKKLELGEAAAREAVAVWSKSGVEPLELGKAYNNLGFVQTAAGKLAEAEASYRKALPLLARHKGRTDPWVRLSLENLVKTLNRQDRLERIEEYIPWLLEFTELAPGSELEASKAMLNRLSDDLNGRGLSRVGERLERRLVALAEKDPGSPLKLAVAIENLGMNLGFQNRMQESETLLARASSLLEPMVAAEPDGQAAPHLARILRQLGVTLNELGRATESEPHYRRAIDIYERRRAIGFGDDDTNDYASAVDGLANSLQSQLRFEEAERYYRIALSVRRQAFGNDSPEVARSANNLASLLSQTKRKEDALGFYQLALASFTKHYGAQHPDTAALQQNVAMMLEEQGKLTEAEGLLRAALATRRAKLGARPFTAVTELNLATVLRRQKRIPEARDLFRSAVNTMAGQLPIEHPYRIVAHRHLGLFHIDFDPNLTVARTELALSGAGAIARAQSQRNFDSRALAEFIESADTFKGQVRAAWQLSRPGAQR